MEWLNQLRLPWPHQARPDDIIRDGLVLIRAGSLYPWFTEGVHLYTAVADVSCGVEFFEEWR